MSMRIDVVTIFPQYFAPLSVSLVGKAATHGIIDTRVHDLRNWTHDVHRTVDDTPYGGGAGMVMRPEPWGECLDDILTDTPGVDATPTDSPDTAPVLVFPSPSGVTFTQDAAQELSNRHHLVFGCGRYEGIDHRVPLWAAGRGVDVREYSLGDYVLNGGEVAALAMIEAVVRLIPGVIGNPASLAEESHSDGLHGLLEYPLYTKPASWRGLDVPEILLSGHHAHIDAWRRDRAVELTRERRPDLLPPAVPEGADPASPQTHS